MLFEEKFPSLDGKEKNFLIREDASSEVSIKEVTEDSVILLIKVKQIRLPGYLKRHVEECCLDKAEVKKELEKHSDCRYEYCNLATDGSRPCWKEILKQFGLDKQIKRGLQ